MHHTIEETIAIVFADVVLVMVVARLMARLFRAIRQPPVVGEIIAEENTAVILGRSTRTVVSMADARAGGHAALQWLKSDR